MATSVSTGFAALAAAILDDARRCILLEKRGTSSSRTFIGQQFEDGRPAQTFIYALSRGEVLREEWYEGIGTYEPVAFGVLVTPNGLDRLFSWAVARATAEYEGRLERLTDEELDRRLAALES